MKPEDNGEGDDGEGEDNLFHIHIAFYTLYCKFRATMMPEGQIF
jgi:hypothetical protein